MLQEIAGVQVPLASPVAVLHYWIGRYGWVGSKYVTRALIMLRITSYGPVLS